MLSVTPSNAQRVSLYILITNNIMKYLWPSEIHRGDREGRKRIFTNQRSRRKHIQSRLRCARNHRVEQRSQCKRTPIRRASRKGNEIHRPRDAEIIRWWQPCVAITSHATNRRPHYDTDSRTRISVLTHRMG